MILDQETELQSQLDIFYDISLSNTYVVAAKKKNVFCAVQEHKKVGLL